MQYFGAGSVGFQRRCELALFVALVVVVVVGLEVLLLCAVGMTELNDERWAFVVEWFDSSADLVRQYQLLYYLMDSTLEMVSAAIASMMMAMAAYSARSDTLSLSLRGAAPPAKDAVGVCLRGMDWGWGFG